MLQELVKQCKPLSPKSRLLILGAGYTGKHVATLAKALGSEVICSRRTINSPGANIAFDSVAKKIPSNSDLKNVTHLLSCIPPNSIGEDPVLTTLAKQLKAMPLEWAGYLSTTGVYGDSKGKWVSESDIPQPIQERSKRRLACEIAWQESGLPVQILRLPGIYGPGRSALDSVKNGKAKMVHKENQVFSRIHVDDIAGAIFHLIDLASNGVQPRVINLADNLPSTNIEVLKYAAKLLNYKLPPILPFELASQQMSEMALSFWQENRRVSNNMLCNKLGYNLMHPTYESGLQDCLMVKK